MNLGPIYMIQSPKNNPKNRGLVVSPVQRSSRHRSYQTRCWRLSSGTRMEFCLQIIQKMGQPSRHTIALHFPTNWSSNWSTDFGTNLHKESCFFKTTLLIAGRSFRTNKLADFYFEVFKRLVCLLDLAPSDYCLFLTSRNISREENFRAFRRPH
jgi:hypothetical protein